MSIANEIKGIRQSCFFSQNSFAEELGVSYSTVNRWETGKTVPNCSMMRKIVDFCKKYDLDYHKVDEAWKEIKNGVDPY